MRGWAWQTSSCVLVPSSRIHQTSPLKNADTARTAVNIMAVDPMTAVSWRLPGRMIIRERRRCKRLLIVGSRGRASPSACANAAASSRRIASGEGFGGQGGGYLSFTKQSLLLMQDWAQRRQVCVAGSHKPSLLTPGEVQCTLQRQTPTGAKIQKAVAHPCYFGMLVICSQAKPRDSPALTRRVCKDHTLCSMSSPS